MAEKKKETKFELGKYYKHDTVGMIYICGVCSRLSGQQMMFSI